MFLLFFHIKQSSKSCSKQHAKNRDAYVRRFEGKKFLPQAKAYMNTANFAKNKSLPTWYC